MKSRTAVAVLALCCLPVAGCLSPKVVKATIEAVGKSDSTLKVHLGTVYGTLDVTRTNPHTNSLPHSVAPDGSIVVGER